MGNVDAFALTGLKCYFGPNDHYPQHFHVLKAGEWLIRVFFLRSNRNRGLNWNYKYHWKGAVSAAEEQELLKQVLAHKRRLLREWNNKVSVAREKEVTKREHKQESPGAQRD